MSNDLESQIQKLVELAKEDPKRVEQAFVKFEDTLELPAICDNCEELIRAGVVGQSIFYPHLCKQCGIIQRMRDIGARV